MTSITSKQTIVDRTTLQKRPIQGLAIERWQWFYGRIKVLSGRPGESQPLGPRILMYKPVLGDNNFILTFVEVEGRPLLQGWVRAENVEIHDYYPVHMRYVPYDTEVSNEKTAT